MRSSLYPRRRRSARRRARKLKDLGAPASGSLPFDQLLGGRDPTVALDPPLEIEQAVEPGRPLLVKIGDLPEVVDTGIIEPLLQSWVDVGQPLEIVGFATRRIDTLKCGRFVASQFLGRGRFCGADIDAGLRLAALDAVDRRPRDQIAVKRDGAPGVVV